MADIDIANEKEVLQYALDSGIITVESIKDVVADMKKKEILAQHSQKIWQGLDGNWHTHIIMEDGKRVVRHRKTREELEDYLVDYYNCLLYTSPSPRD